MPGHFDKRVMLERMSFYSDQAGIYGRFLREEDNWRSHIEKCHQFILESISITQPKTVIVLGSGHLLDFPLYEVLKKIGTIKLIDIIHPPHVKNLASAESSIELIEADITGGLIEATWNYSRLKRSRRNPEELLNFQSEFMLEMNEGQLVISLNILSQLNTLLVEFLTEKALLTEKEIMLFSSMIQESHLRMLGRHEFVLITDTLEISRGPGELHSSKGLVFGELPKGIKNSTWEWVFDTTGSYKNNTDTKMHVYASLNRKNQK